MDTKCLCESHCTVVNSEEERPANNSDLLNGDGEIYTPDQLQELRKYLSFLADLAIETYYHEETGNEVRGDNESRK